MELLVGFFDSNMLSHLLSQSSSSIGTHRTYLHPRVIEVLRDSAGGEHHPIPFPRHSMYAIYAYIDPPNHPNVGIYGIHGVSGFGMGLEDQGRARGLGY